MHPRPRRTRDSSLRAWLRSSSVLASMAVEACMVAMEVLSSLRQWTARRGRLEERREELRRRPQGRGCAGGAAARQPLRRRIHQCSSRGGHHGFGQISLCSVNHRRRSRRHGSRDDGELDVRGDGELEMRGDGELEVDLAARAMAAVTATTPTDAGRRSSANSLEHKNTHVH
jgi:hypothetical protein